MGVKYRVMVIRETETDDEVSSERLVELAAPVEMLRQFAPSAVAAALGTSAMDAALTTRIDPEPEAQADRPKRARRTKAEMEAARAAEAGAEEKVAEPQPMAMEGGYNPFGGNA